MENSKIRITGRTINDVKIRDSLNIQLPETSVGIRTRTGDG
jgi:hypothetical protein